MAFRSHRHLLRMHSVYGMSWLRSLARLMHMSSMRLHPKQKPESVASRLRAAVREPGKLRATDLPPKYKVHKKTGLNAYLQRRKEDRLLYGPAVRQKTKAAAKKAKTEPAESPNRRKKGSQMQRDVGGSESAAMAADPEGLSIGTGDFNEEAFNLENSMLFGPALPFTKVNRSAGNYSDSSESEDRRQVLTLGDNHNPYSGSNTESNVRQGRVPKNKLDTSLISIMKEKILSFPLWNPERSREGIVTPQEHNLDIPQHDTEMYPSVSAVLRETAPPQSTLALLRWKKQMIAQLGEAGFYKLNQDTLRAGQRLHDCVQVALGGTGASVAADDDVRGYWTSVARVLDDVSDVRALETSVSHRRLKYAGKTDCIARHDGRLCLIDWKTSKKPKRTLSSTFDNPLQVAAYAGAVNFDLSFDDLQVEQTMLVIAYQSGEPADVHFMSTEVLQGYWRLWLERLSQYWAGIWRKRLE
ncbi:PREDICTED: mitochondrial genome maintenance exonuclease 1-like [Priapulus caudatus]|uniref:Mitochondrial genome maintenance exonuclease 1 n=1 Tax=Priapulus caudatus TaxID=37621 RepID=A0ABM1EFH6_PRICU|nr:PREDICTED: mitochondrial genome maintenance exonuclease 1-like [Priapulus caudatus]